jgi:bifunctional non-homologous end joining protein LigD
VPIRTVAGKTVVEVEGRRLALSNLDKVLYPEAGFTKAEVIDYYARIAAVMVPHLAGRGVTLRRFPEGVAGHSFYEKRCASHRPDWLDTVPGPGDRRGGIDYCCLDSAPAVVWAANMAAIEIHAPMARGEDPDRPTMCVFDLDPGEPSGIAECADVALDIRHILDQLGLVAFAKTSGSKGLQVYVPLNTPHTHQRCAAFALAVAELLERVRSQNSHHKTTVAVYSLRARPRPTVSTPVTWDEVEAVASAGSGSVLAFEAADVLGRVAALGDLFAPVTSLEQELPESLD